jgi:hypothetical protein
MAPHEEPLMGNPIRSDEIEVAIFRVKLRILSWEARIDGRQDFGNQNFWNATSEKDLAYQKNI